MFYSIINIQQKIKYLWSSYKGDKKEIEIDRILITIEVYKSDYLFFLFFLSYQTMKSIGWIIGVIALVVLYSISRYNGSISAQWGLNSTQAQVNNMYERRKDLVPQVAAVVKKYAEYESGTLVGVTSLRTQSASLDKLNGMIAQWDFKSSEFSSLLASTMWGIKVNLEAYPTLKADTQFTNLYTTLEWSENRIRTAIKDFNDSAASYNARLKLFPGNLINKIFSFEPFSLINPPADKDIKEVPDVENLLK